MSKKLKIYACSGIGETGVNGYYAYWTDKTNPADNTQAANTLLSLINNLKIEVLYLEGLTDEEKIARLNDLSLYRTCLQVVRDLKDDPDALVSTGYILGSWLANGEFANSSLDLEVHENQIMGLVERINEYYHAPIPDGDIDKKFVTWWNEVIVPRNKVGLSKEQRTAVKKAEQSIKISGIGASDNWKEDKNISNYLLNAAVYFTYYYFTKDQLQQLPRKFTTKRNTQKRLYNYCAAYFVKTYGSISDMDNIIRSGIIQKYGHTPEEVCAKIVSGDIKPVNGGPEPVSWTIEAIVAVVLAALSTLAAIVTAIINAIRDCKVAKYEAITAEQANKGCPNPEDYEDYNSEKGWTNIKSNWLPLAAIGVGLVLLIKRSR